VSRCAVSHTKDGDTVMERLVDNRIIEQEFQTLKRMIRRAQNLDSGRQGAGVDID